MSPMSCALIFLCLLSAKSVLSIDDCGEVIVDISKGTNSANDDIIFQDVTYTSSDYFSNSSGKFGCACKVLRCVHDCCQSNQMLDTSSGTVTCVSSRNNITQINDHPALFNIIRVPNRPVCRNHTLVFNLTTDQYVSQLNTKGYLTIMETDFHYSNYCVSPQSSDSVQVVACYSGGNGIDLIVAGTGMIISMPFLFITFLVYLILPDKNVHQYALMLYVLTLLLAYVLLVTINLSESLPTFFCTGAAYGTLFLFMVSFFWMNVICFDIWYTFSGGRGYIVSSRKSERKRFLIYTAYAVGIPILHVCIVALLDKYLDEESIHKPNIGIKKCFLDDGWPSLWYMYGEAAILVLINVVFFTLTALKIRQVKKETLMLKQNESKRHALEKEKRRFNLFLKLFLAMGVNWTMEVISWLVNWQTTDKYTYIWYITDFINAVYGGVIFFIFVFKRKIWKMLQKRYYNFIGKPHLARAVTTTTDTRTSHYSSATDTNLTERTNITERRNNGIPTEELALRRA
ncbi:G-protein coupled receptor Mth2-like isoform X2 [Rhynchophorus ferrugineus]|uniref:G-protein coupled receptor Mth2-like isoform X2 n=1 Tax=Rhynchophorus ferrugineus TaxID=354439 RepID=UPI003FCEC0E0